MHAGAFDRLTSSLFTAGSRRIALRALLAATALSLAGGQRAAALSPCLTNGRGCSDGGVCCSGLCKRKRGSRKKICQKADHQGTCDIEQDGCLGTDTCNENPQCYCYVTTSGQSFCGGPIERLLTGSHLVARFE